MAMATELKMQLWHRIDSRAIKCVITSVTKNPRNILNARDYEKRYKDLLMQLAGKENHGKMWDEVNIVINSQGGATDSAYGLLSALWFCYKKMKMKTQILIDGTCASAATYIACGFSKKKVPVYITPGSKYIIHNPKRQVFHRRKGGMWDAIVKAGSKATTRDMVNMYANRTGQSKKQIREWMDANKCFTAEEAVRYGFCDKVIQKHEFYWW